MNKKKIIKILSDRKFELLEDQKLTNKDRKPVQLDQSVQGRLSRIDAMQQAELARSIERRRSIEVSRINAALIRLEKGNYGYCLGCDEEIPSRRLAVDYSEPLCIDCSSMKI